MQFDIKTAIYIFSGYLAVVTIGYGWIIRIVMKIYKGAIITSNEDGKIKLEIAKQDTKIAEHGKDIEHLKKQGDGFEKKIEDLSINIGTLNLSVNETSAGLRLLKEQVGEMNKKFESMDKKLNHIIISLKNK